MKLRQLRYLAKAVETGNVTEAARILNVSQPALSAGIGALEAELGAPVLERRRDGVRLTPNGARFHRRVLRILQEAEAAKLEFLQGRDGGQLKLGVLPSIDLALVLSLVRHLGGILPKAEVSLREANVPTLLQWLSSGHIDAAVLSLEAAEGGGWVPVFNECMGLVCPPSHALALRARVEMADLDGEAFILRGHCERSADAHAMLNARGIRPRIVMRTDQEARALDAVRAGLGVTISSAGGAGDLITRPIEDLGLRRTIGIHLAPDLDGKTGKLLIGAFQDVTRAQGQTLVL